MERPLHQSSRRRTSSRPSYHIAEVGNLNLTHLTPTPLLACLVLLQPVRGNVKLGYMTDRGHGDRVFKCHAQAWAQLCKILLG